LVWSALPLFLKQVALHCKVDTQGRSGPGVEHADIPDLLPPQELNPGFCTKKPGTRSPIGIEGLIFFALPAALALVTVTIVCQLTPRDLQQHARTCALIWRGPRPDPAALRARLLHGQAAADDPERGRQGTVP
jgi:hypothetical protein